MTTLSLNPRTSLITSIETRDALMAEGDDSLVKFVARDQMSLSGYTRTFSELPILDVASSISKSMVSAAETVVGTVLCFNRLGSQGLIAFLPETNERIDLVIGDQIDGYVSKQSTAKYISQPRAVVDTFKGILGSWRNHLAAHHVQGLHRRLEFIFEDERMLENQLRLTYSFSAMLAYLATRPELRTPSIGYNRDGSFSVVWSSEKKLRVTLDFVGVDSIRWVFVDSRNGINNAITGAGTVNHQILNRVLDSYGAFDWMKLEG